MGQNGKVSVRSDTQRDRWGAAARRRFSTEAVPGHRVPIPGGLTAERSTILVAEQPERLAPRWNRTAEHVRGRPRPVIGSIDRSTVPRFSRSEKPEPHRPGWPATANAAPSAYHTGCGTRTNGPGRGRVQSAYPALPIEPSLATREACARFLTFADVFLSFADLFLAGRGTARQSGYPGARPRWRRFKGLQRQASRLPFGLARRFAVCGSARLCKAALVAL